MASQGGGAVSPIFISLSFNLFYSTQCKETQSMSRHTDVNSPSSTQGTNRNWQAKQHAGTNEAREKVNSRQRERENAPEDDFFDSK